MITFWAITCALAIVVATPLVAALLRRDGSTRDRADYDVALYREQLRAVDGDLSRGVIDADAAERARAEIGRRILEADSDRRGGPAHDAPRMASVGAAGLMIVLIGTGSMVLYTTLGAPGYGDQPRMTRIQAAEDRRANRPTQAAAEAQAPARPAPDVGADRRDLVEQLRETMQRRPDDPRGLRLLVRNEAALGNLQAAYRAQDQLIDVLGPETTAQDHADQADLMIQAAGGYVSPAAAASLDGALEVDPRNGTARYYTGLLQAQIGRPDQAFETWRDLLAESRPEAPWVPLIRGQIERVAAQAGARYTLPPDTTAPQAPGPSQAQIDAAGEMSAEARAEMIQGMVTRLSDRLANEGGPPADWARLIAALGVIGQADRATAIWQEARTTFAEQPGALASIDAAARQAGLSQ